MIRLNKVSKSFKKQVVLKEIDLHVHTNETVVVCGPGGCGKTILMKLCQGLLKPDTGQIIINNKDIGLMKESELMHFRLDTGVLFQNYALFDSMTVAQNVGFYLANHTKKKIKEINTEVSKYLSMVRLQNAHDLLPSELSGGMQKRVGIARALVHKPSIMFYDSPTDGLDPVTSDAIVDNILSLNSELGVTSLVISNDMNTAFRLGDRIALLNNGIIHAIGTPTEMSNSKDPYVYQFIRGLRDGPLYNDVAV